MSQLILRLAGLALFLVFVSLACAPASPPWPTPTPMPTPTPDSRPVVHITGFNQYVKTDMFSNSRWISLPAGAIWSNALYKLDRVLRRDDRSGWPRTDIDIIIWVGDSSLFYFPDSPVSADATSCTGPAGRSWNCTYYPTEIPLFENAASLRQWVRGGGVLIIGPITRALEITSGLFQPNIRFQRIVGTAMHTIPKVVVHSMLEPGREFEGILYSRTYPGEVDYVRFSVDNPQAKGWAVYEESPVVVEIPFGHGMILLHQLDWDDCSSLRTGSCEEQTDQDKMIGDTMLRYASKFALQRRSAVGAQHMAQSTDTVEDTFEKLLVLRASLKEGNNQSIRVAEEIKLSVELVS